MSSLSFVSGAEKIVLGSYLHLEQHSQLLAEIVSRVAAVALLSLSAALDMAFHTAMILPALLYACGKSAIQGQADFTLPWQHLQRVRNAVAPLILGSALGLIHPYAGLFASEPTDKHIVAGMLSSNVCQLSETPCSPVHSLQMSSEIASSCKEVFSEQEREALRDAASYEYSLQSLQAQEYIHKITNVTLYAMAQIKIAIDYSGLNDFTKEALVRLSGVLVPVLTAVDLVIVVLVQAFFLTTGVIRLISGRGPIYTEATTNPLMHVSFLIQNILKVVGNLVGTLVWFVSPLDGFRVSLSLPNLYFKIELAIFNLRLKARMFFMQENSRFLLPIVYGTGECSVLSVPTHSMHKTYLIVEQKEGAFNLYWVNRPFVEAKRGLTLGEASLQIGEMLDERYPFMDIEKMMNYPVKAKSPSFGGAISLSQVASQGSPTNCVVSNLFGALEVMDRLEGKDESFSAFRYLCVRKYLDKTYGFYQGGFYPFSNSLTLEGLFESSRNHPTASI
ncbi:hypothetical protein [Estrella lausannensis]|uniref:Uncharacterized protein n=1 Tax=Estrella lausannensis TaxID=483423 RepID=A0A0H5DP31_9BACT|nr:hypothetical protein [Estrella lausannensis]CRX37653.1 hypothetical protein ELAC_0292 [Estrella lausannensis]